MIPAEHATKIVKELRGMSFEALKRLVDEPLFRKEVIDGKTYCIEVSARCAAGRVHLMIEYARDLPILRRFARAMYVSIGSDGSIYESSAPW